MTLDLDNLERIGKAATEGPWSQTPMHHKDEHGEWNYFSLDAPVVSVGSIDMAPDAKFIMAARNNWDALIDAVDQAHGLRELLDADRAGGGETIGDTLIRLARSDVTDDWRDWLIDYGHRINAYLEETMEQREHARDAKRTMEQRWEDEDAQRTG